MRLGNGATSLTLGRSPPARSTALPATAFDRDRRHGGHHRLGDDRCRSPHAAGVADHGGGQQQHHHPGRHCRGRWRRAATTSTRSSTARFHHRLGGIDTSPRPPRARSLRSARREADAVGAPPSTGQATGSPTRSRATAPPTSSAAAGNDTSTAAPATISSTAGSATTG